MRAASKLTMWIGLTAGLLYAPVASAYLDPSTGSMVITAIVGLFASAVLAARTYWHKLVTFLRGEKRSSSGRSADGSGGERGL